MPDNIPQPAPPSYGDQDFMQLQGMLDQNNDNDKNKKQSQSNSDPMESLSKISDMADTPTDPGSMLSSSAMDSVGAGSGGGSSSGLVSGVVETVEANPEVLLVAL